MRLPCYIVAICVSQIEGYKAFSLGFPDCVPQSATMKKNRMTIWPSYIICSIVCLLFCRSFGGFSRSIG